MHAMESADVVIIGGGVVGVSAAFHLAEAGAKVVLFERDQLGSGSTSKAAGGVRAQFSDPLNIRDRPAQPRAASRTSPDRPGWEIDLHEVGYLFLLTREAEVEAFTRNVALQNELGVPSRMVTPQEAQELCPLLEVDDVLAASYSPEDGHATPEAVVHGLRLRRPPARREAADGPRGRGDRARATAASPRSAPTAKPSRRTP